MKLGQNEILELMSKGQKSRSQRGKMYMYFSGGDIAPSKTSLVQLS